MAESVVNFVLGKLADVVVKEVMLQHGVDKQVETVRREISRIQAFLKDADKKQITNESQKHWVKEVRDVAYSIEDVIDTFLLEVPQEPQEPSQEAQICCQVLQDVKKVIKRTKKIPAARKLVDEINQIQTTMKEIEASRVRYGINNLGEGSGEIIRLPVRPPALPDIDPNIVGFKEDQDHVVKDLLDKTTKRRSVVSIWRPGGLGKTTLARKVYNCNDVERQFGIRIWLVISKKFEVIDVLRNIAQKLQPPIKLSDQAKEEDFLTEIYKSLRGKKYLIVLDDVWTSDLWIQIGEAFPDENNGSRLLITTRNFDVAKDVDPMGEPYKPKFLTAELSRELLLKIIFPNQDPNKSSFDDLSIILGQFIHKCGGLPLALVVLGGLLAKKPRSYTAWSNVLRTMRWHVEKNCSEIIGTSYEDLPLALKSCFMYFAAFSEDYDIHAPSLLHMWIAEGFIPQEDNRTLEETAESYLEDLVQRSMVQVSERNFDGYIVYCRIHDLLRDFALQKVKEDNFLEVYSHPDDQTSLSKARRVAIHNSDCDKVVMSQNLRTLLCFRSIRMSNCSKQRLLKVVRSGDNEANVIELGMFKGLTHLRYLELTGMLSDECKEECLEEVIGGMKFLQTLDVRELTIDGDNKVELPDCAWHIKTLRHVFLSNKNKLITLGGEIDQAALGPPLSAKLTNLQTISRMCIRESWETELPYLPNLRTLNLVHQSSSWKVVATFLATLKHLISLLILTDYPIPSDIFDMRHFSFYEHLQFLILLAVKNFEIPNEMVLHEDMFPSHLTTLQIFNCCFQLDPMSILEKLRCLKKLLLYKACANRKMRCSYRGFSQLELLDLSLLPTEEWEIEEGAMPILKELEIYRCSQLDVPHGLKYLTNLQEFTWTWNARGKADLIRNLCKHVPSLNIN